MVTNPNSNPKPHDRTGQSDLIQLNLSLQFTRIAKMEPFSSWGQRAFDSESKLMSWQSIKSHENLLNPNPTRTLARRPQMFHPQVTINTSVMSPQKPVPCI